MDVNHLLYNWNIIVLGLGFVLSVFLYMKWRKYENDRVCRVIFFISAFSIFIFPTSLMVIYSDKLFYSETMLFEIQPDMRITMVCLAVFICILLSLVCLIYFDRLVCKPENKTKDEEIRDMDKMAFQLWTILVNGNNQEEMKARTKTKTVNICKKIVGLLSMEEINALLDINPNIKKESGILMDNIKSEE